MKTESIKKSNYPLAINIRWYVKQAKLYERGFIAVVFYHMTALDTFASRAFLFSPHPDIYQFPTILSAM